MRRPGWDSALIDYLEANLNTAFQWGVFDCVTFACECSRLVAGVHPWPELVGTYSTGEQAQKVIDRVTGKINGSVYDFMSLSAEKCGFRQVLPSFARRGDWIIFDDPERGPAAGIAMGRYAVVTGENGLVYHPMVSCSYAWRVE